VRPMTAVIRQATMMKNGYRIENRDMDVRK
jgi:hypothetical protein